MSRTEVVDLLEKTLTENEIAYSRKSGGGADVDHVILELPGEQKLKTTVLLTASEHGVSV